MSHTRRHCIGKQQFGALGALLQGNLRDQQKFSGEVAHHDSRHLNKPPPRYQEPQAPQFQGLGKPRLPDPLVKRPRLEAGRRDGPPKLFLDFLGIEAGQIDGRRREQYVRLFPIPVLQDEAVRVDVG